jgi:hypothetical protein
MRTWSASSANQKKEHGEGSKEQIEEGDEDLHLPVHHPSSADHDMIRHSNEAGSDKEAADRMMMIRASQSNGLIMMDRALALSSIIQESSDDDTAEAEGETAAIRSPLSGKKRGRPSKHEPLRVFTKPSELASTRSRASMMNLSASVARRSTQVSGVSVDVDGHMQQCSSVLMLEINNLKHTNYFGGSFTSKFVRDKPLLRIIGGENREHVKQILTQCLSSLSNPEEEIFEHVFLHTEEEVKEYYRAEDDLRKAEAKQAIEAKSSSSTSSKILLET